IGVEIVRDRDGRQPDPDFVGHVMVEALARGFILLGGGVDSNVLSFSPPLSITREQMDAAVEMLQEVLASSARRAAPGI
ncbi:MAG TPA: hypothetical protein VMN39_00660, partial [Longimicrobiaceae bacterium]|nr:hypothetical protein [Longimicrobiaceae bacterium]